MRLPQAGPEPAEAGFVAAGPRGADSTASLLAGHPRVLPRRHLPDLDDWWPAELRPIIDRAAGMRALLHQSAVPGAHIATGGLQSAPSVYAAASVPRSDPRARTDALRGRVLVNLFYENSTRTRVSF